MLKEFNRNTFVFDNQDVATLFTQNSLISKRLPLESFTVNTDNTVTVIYATWDTLTEDEKLDTVFYPNIIAKEFDIPFTDYGKTQVDVYSWGYDKAPDKMPICKKCHRQAVPNNFYGFWCPTCNAYPTF